MNGMNIYMSDKDEEFSNEHSKNTENKESNDKNSSIITSVKKRNRETIRYSNDQDERFSENSEYIEDKNAKGWKHQDKDGTSSIVSTAKTDKIKKGEAAEENETNKKQRSRKNVSSGSGWDQEEDDFMNELVSLFELEETNSNINQIFENKNQMALYISYKLNDKFKGNRTLYAVRSRLTIKDSTEAARVFQSFNVKRKPYFPFPLPEYYHFHLNKDKSFKSIKTTELFADAYNSLYTKPDRCDFSNFNLNNDGSIETLKNSILSETAANVYLKSINRTRESITDNEEFQEEVKKTAILLLQRSNIGIHKNETLESIEKEELIRIALKLLKEDREYYNIMYISAVGILFIFFY